MFIFYPIQKEIRDNTAVASRHRRHSAKSFKTNTLEGLWVHAGCSGGNEEEIDFHRRTREEHSTVMLLGQLPQSMTVVVLCCDKGIRLWWNLNTDLFDKDKVIGSFSEQLVCGAVLQQGKRSQLVLIVLWLGPTGGIRRDENENQS